MREFLQDHAGKVGAGGVLGAITLTHVSMIAATAASVVTVAAVLPVAIERWRDFLRKK